MQMGRNTLFSIRFGCRQSSFLLRTIHTQRGPRWKLDLLL